MTEGCGKKSKQLDSYRSLPEGVQERLDFLFNHLYIRSKIWVGQARQMREFGINLRERLVLEMLYFSGPDGLPQHVIGGHFGMPPSGGHQR